MAFSLPSLLSRQLVGPVEFVAHLPAVAFPPYATPSLSGDLVGAQLRDVEGDDMDG